MEREVFFARRVADKRTLAVCCLCATLILLVAGCSKKQEQTGDLPSSDITEIPGKTELTGVPEATDVPNPTENMKPDGEKLQTSILSGTANEILTCFRGRTLEYAQAMLAGNFSVYDAFSEELKKTLSERDMKAAWKQAVQGLGQPLSENGEEAQETAQTAVTAESSFLNPPALKDAEGSIEDFGGYVITSAQIPYKTKIVILSITYDSAGAIAGIYLTYTLPETTPETTEYYTEYEVGVGEGNYPLSGLLTMPNGVENPPVVLFVHGSGQSDKNETIGAEGNTPFADIARGLAKQGIASLRYDKRYYQYPELAAGNITIQDEVLDDAAAALALLAAREDVDVKRIYVLGHSLGGMLAPYIVKENPQAAGIISLAGSPRGLWEIVHDQNIAAIEMAEFGGAEETELLKMVQEEYEKVLSLVADVRGGADIEEERLFEALFGVSGYYWASLAGIDTAKAAEELDVPMLILQGSADFQVYPDRDYAAWQVLLEGRENVAFRLFEGLNHLFMVSNGAMDVTEYDTKAQVAQEVIDVIAAWIVSGGDKNTVEGLSQEKTPSPISSE